MKDGFYRIWLRSEKKQTCGELRTVDGVQYLYLIGYDEAFNPEDFIIIHEIFIAKYTPTE
jgi:hypothetical protein